jgi:hypothetical protein
VPAAPAASCALCIGRTHTSNNEYTGIARHSRTQWFYGLCRALPGDRALLPPSPRGYRFVTARLGQQNSANLTPASGRQDHTILPSAKSVSRPRAVDRSRIPEKPPCDPVARKTLPRPPHPVPYVRDDRETPLCVGRDAKSSRSDLGGVKTKIFLQKGLDTPVNKPPDGQITKRPREQIPLASRTEINPSFPDVQLHIVGAPLGASPESITTTGSMDSGPAHPSRLLPTWTTILPNSGKPEVGGASTMCNCTSGNDAGVDAARCAAPGEPPEPAGQNKAPAMAKKRENSLR